MLAREQEAMTLALYWNARPNEVASSSVPNVVHIRMRGYYDQQELCKFFKARINDIQTTMSINPQNKVIIDVEEELDSDGIRIYNCEECARVAYRTEGVHVRFWKVIR